MGAAGREEIQIRSYEERSDRTRVVDLERRCGVGLAERSSLLMDTMGDPIARIRNTPLHNVLVAEREGQLVGVVMGTLKVVTLRNPPTDRARVGYILGLRVSPLHRRRGIATRLVRRLEHWFLAHAADYAYMATHPQNAPSIALFVDNLGFRRFRTPVILLHPIARPLRDRPPPQVDVTRVDPSDGERLYRTNMGSAEFFPHDIGAVLANRLSLGTWVACPRGREWGDPGSSWAMASVWDCGEVYKLRVGKTAWRWRAYAKARRWADRAVPCLRPGTPDLFRPFGFYFVYGVHAEGPAAGAVVRGLWEFLRGMARRRGGRCEVMVTEVGGGGDGGDAALMDHVPRCKWVSCPRDVWCIKPLLRGDGDGRWRENWEELRCEWTQIPPTRPLFVDPREV